MVEEQLGSGTPADAHMIQYRRTALHWASEARVWVWCGVYDVGAGADDGGWQEGHAEVCECLLKHKADANFRDRTGATALHKVRERWVWA